MKRIITVLAAMLAAFGTASAANVPDSLQLASGKRVETTVRVVLPVYFGVSTLLDADYLGSWANTGYGDFLGTRIEQNFNFDIEFFGLRFDAKSTPFEANLGLRFSFMDFSLSDTSITFSGNDSPSSIGCMPVRISDTDLSFDGAKSKIHASYLGAPVRFAMKYGAHGKIFVGVAPELLIHGYTKYRYPAHRSEAGTLFNPLRVSVEGGICYYGFGLWARYGLTPLFLPGCSNAKTLSFGLTVGI